jgi:ankyrin repeat protein
MERLLEDPWFRNVLGQKTILGETLLHLAVMFSAHTTEKVRVLIPLMPDLNVRDDDGETPLDIAEKMGLIEVQEMLRKAGAKTGKELRD